MERLALSILQDNSDETIQKIALPFLVKVGCFFQEPLDTRDDSRWSVEWYGMRVKTMNV
jgi:hypothetical protein